MSLIEELSEICPEATTFDGLDEAIIALADNGVGVIAVYDNNAMVKIIMKDGMDEEEAQEYIDYNIVRSLPYMGDYKPVIIFRTLEE